MSRTSFSITLATVLVLVVASFSVPLPVDAATTMVSGDVSGTWTVDGSPYLIGGDITVPAGQTLTIAPGVEVLFESWYKLTVNGTLLAEGTAESPILFTGTHPTAGWLGIRLINASDASRLTYVVIEKGRATGAAPLNVGGGLYIENSSPTISFSTFRDNYATTSGGGIYLTGSNAVLSDNVLANNSVSTGGSGFGGGIYMVDSNPELTHNLIAGNRVYVSGSYSTPTGLGGGLYARRSSPVLRYNVIRDNVVDAHLNSHARGGGLYFYFGAPDLIHNTITGNSVTETTAAYDREGGGIYLYGSNLTLVNNILWNDTPQELFVGDFATLTLAYSDVQGGQAGVAIEGSPTVNDAGGNLDADPLFVDATNGDVQLQAASPAIDAGTAFFEWQGRVLLDLAPGQYAGAAPDMGAFESAVSIERHMHVQDQVVTRVASRRRATALDTVLIADQDHVPLAGALVTARYWGPSQGQVSGTTGADGTVVLETNRVRKPEGVWCFEVLDVSKDGYVYDPGANVVTVQCESN